MMERFLKIVALVIVVAASSYVALTLSDPRLYLGWPAPQTFVPVPAENRPLEPDLLLSSSRMPDADRTHPSPGAAAEAEIEAQGGSDFPVLLPHGFGASAESLAATKLRLRMLDDGYYSVFQSATMEITILGTRTTWHKGEALSSGVQQDYVNGFEDPGNIPAGGAIAFGHFGADYSVTFDCIDTSPGLTQNCVSKEAAEAFVANLTAGDPTDLQIPPALSS